MTVTRILIKVILVIVLCRIEILKGLNGGHDRVLPLTTVIQL